MPLYNIYAGLGGGFGGAYLVNVEDVEDIDTASEYAYQAACEIYDSYDGANGLFNREEALEEDPNLSDEELDEMYSEDRESWIDYYAILTSEDDN